MSLPPFFTPGISPMTSNHVYVQKWEQREHPAMHRSKCRKLMNSAFYEVMAFLSQQPGAVISHEPRSSNASPALSLCGWQLKNSDCLVSRHLFASVYEATLVLTQYIERNEGVETLLWSPASASCCARSGLTSQQGAERQGTSVYL